MRRTSLILALFCCSWVAKGQGPTAPSGTGSLQIRQSERIRSLMTEFSGRKQALKGFRVQVFLGSREQAEELRRNFLAKHPEVPAYLSYLAPNFRVRVGDLRDRVAAERLREQLRSEFPGLYVVADEIQTPKLQSEP